MAAANKQEKDPVNFVHQNAILCETISKENRHQKLFVNYVINPFTKNHPLAGKPNSKNDAEDEQEDDHFLTVIRRARQEPVKKYVTPQTEAQEYGWISRPLVEQDVTDKRLCFRRSNSSITKYMDAAWRIKEQQENMN